MDENCWAVILSFLSIFELQQHHRLNKQTQYVLQNYTHAWPQYLHFSERIMLYLPHYALANITHLQATFSRVRRVTRDHWKQWSAWLARFPRLVWLQVPKHISQDFFAFLVTLLPPKACMSLYLRFDSQVIDFSVLESLELRLNRRSKFRHLKTSAHLKTLCFHMLDRKVKPEAFEFISRCSSLTRFILKYPYHADVVLEFMPFADLHLLKEIVTTDVTTDILAFPTHFPVSPIIEALNLKRKDGTWWYSR